MTDLRIHNVLYEDENYYYCEATRCPFCGSFFPRLEQIHGHYATTCCHQVMEGCCNGETCPTPDSPTR